MKLRYYQEEAVQSVFDYINSGKKGNPIIALITGGGKSVIIAEFIRRTMQQNPATRTIMLTHSKELIVQNAEKLQTIWQAAPVGIYSAGVGRKDHGLPITFGGVQSAAKAIEKKGNIFGRIDFMVVDECHTISPSEETTYRKVISALKEDNPNLIVIGLTATPYRLKDGLLTNEECGIFTDFCYDKTRPEDFLEFIENGFISPIIPKRTESQFDLSGVHTVAGDFNSRELEEATGDHDIISKCLSETIAASQGRKKWITFVSGVDNCEYVAEEFRKRGIPTECVHSKKSKSENDAIIADFKAGRFINLVNANKLTTGFDAPDIDLICMMRPTQSAALWVQMIGRGLRIAQNKKDCLVLDFAGNTERIGPINNPFIKNKYGKKGRQSDAPPPIKICPSCNAYNAAGVKFCFNCNHEFTFENSKLISVASNKDLIIDTRPVYETLDVTNVFYSPYQPKNGNPQMIKVTYICGMQGYDEYICAGWEGYVGIKAKKWLDARIGQEANKGFDASLIALRKSRMPKKLTLATKENETSVFMVEF